MKLVMNSNAIRHETDKALLIKLPGSELSFWYPKRFCRQSGKSNYMLTLWFGDASWEIKAQRTSERTSAVLETLVATVGVVAERYGIEVRD